MENLTGGSSDGVLRLDFDRRLTLRVSRLFLEAGQGSVLDWLRRCQRAQKVLAWVATADGTFERLSK
jgi:hypothetical protein